jgi:hypothetical protein
MPQVLRHHCGCAAQGQVMIKLAETGGKVPDSLKT